MFFQTEEKVVELETSVFVVVFNPDSVEMGGEQFGLGFFFFHSLLNGHWKDSISLTMTWRKSRTGFKGGWWRVVEGRGGAGGGGLVHRTALRVGPRLSFSQARRNCTVKAPRRNAPCFYVEKSKN